MNNKDSRLKYFNPASLTDNEIKKIKYYLRDSGLDSKEIYKILKENGFIVDDEIQIKEDNSMGKGKK